MADRPRILVHLVHGTFAPKAPWTEETSYFCTRLKTRLDHLDIEFTRPQWGGQNRHAARLAGAGTVRAALRAGNPQFVIGHSHGGNVCFLACRDLDATLARDVRGVACLSTPFLLVRRDDYARTMYLACWSAWWLVAMFGLTPVLDSSTWALLLSLPIVIAFAWFFRWAHTHGYRDPESLSVPSSLPFPTLLIRCPGDEASAALGASLLVERLTVWLVTKVSSCWVWIDRHLLLAFAWCVGVILLCMAAILASLSLSGSLQPLMWPAIVLAAIVLTVFVLPLMLGWPLRSLVYWWSYGSDIATRGTFLDITAESTPAGRWELHTVFPKRRDSGIPTLVHSEPYENEEAVDMLATWMKGLLEQDRPAS